MSTSDIVAALRKPKTMVAVAVAAVIVIVWLLAYFLPAGSKISTLNTETAAIQTEITAENAKLAAIRHTGKSIAMLRAMKASLGAYVPSTIGIYDYVDQLSATVAKSQMALTTVTPGADTPISGSPYTTVGVELTVKGTYDHLLSLITNLYAMPRLTVITTLTISGGGPGTNRSTPLDATLDLDTFTTAKPITIP